ncbi:MAG: hypothetical protein ACRD1E_13290 [Terriglobales bacterium]
MPEASVDPSGLCQLFSPASPKIRTPPAANGCWPTPAASAQNGWYLASAQHYPNGVASNLVVPGLAPVVNYGLDGEGRPNLIDGATTLVSAAGYSADGLASITFGSDDSDAYSYDAATGRMTQYSFTVNGTSNIGALAWDSNGTLASLGLTQNI